MMQTLGLRLTADPLEHVSVMHRDAHTWRGRHMGGWTNARSAGVAGVQGGVGSLEDHLDLAA